MKKRTFLFNYGPVLVFLCFLAAIVPLSNAVSSEKFGVQALESESLGVLSATAVFENSIYIGAENGLFELTGNYVKHLDVGSQELSGGYISSLDVDDNVVWLTLYGKNIVAFDMQNSSFRNVLIDDYLDEYFGVVKVRENKLFATFLSGAVLFDLSTKKIIKTLYLDEFSKNSDDEIKAVAKTSESFLLLSDSGLFRVNQETGDTIFSSHEKFAPELTNLQSMSVDGDKLLIAGQNGVLVLHEHSLEKIRLLEFDEFSVRGVSSLLLDSNGRLLVAAGDIYVEQNNRLIKADFLQPFLDASNISTVLSLLELENGQILLNSSQRGLVVIPSTHDALNFVSRNRIEFPNNVFDQVKFSDNKYVISADSGYYILDKLTGNLTDIEQIHLEDSTLFKIGNVVYDLNSCFPVKNEIRIIRQF